VKYLKETSPYRISGYSVEQSFTVHSYDG